MRETARHFAPRGIALGLQERRDVVEHHDITHIAIGIRQRRARAHERAATGAAVEIDLFAPLFSSGGKTHSERCDELAEALIVRSQLRQRATDSCRHVHAENYASRRIGSAHGEHAIYTEHTRG